MKRWIPLLAATGICTSITVTLWQDRTGGQLSHAADLAGSAGIVLVTVLLGWIASGWFTRDYDRRGLVALLTGLWAIAFGTFQVAAAAYLHTAVQRAWLAALLWTLIIGGAVWIVLRSRVSLAFISRVLVIAAVFLVASDMLGFVRGGARVAARDVPRGQTGTVGVPSVYLIVLDKYSSGAWLQHSYGLDHSPFEDSLRSLGFVVPRYARANYAHTQISLASLLNWRYADDSANGGALTWPAMTEQIGNARVWQAFRDRGYRTVSFTTTFPATRQLSGADVEVPTPTIHPSRLPLTFLSNSPLAGVHGHCGTVPCVTRQSVTTPYPIERLADIEWKLDAVADLADSGDPVFAFVHLLVPHEPYLFASDCSAREPWWPLSDQGELYDAVGAAYADQVRCLMPLLLKAVRSIIQRSSVEPVIILQSDHGHGRIAVNPLRGFTLTAGEATDLRIGERLGVFAAYRFPGADTLVRDDISAVNVLPLVFAALNGENADLQPDRSYWSSYQAAFEFVEIPPALTRPPTVTTSRQRRGSNRISATAP